MGQITKTTYIELRVEVDADYTPGYPAVMTLPNGDPGYPAEPEELEITGVRVLTERDEPADDILASLSPEQVAQLEEQVMEDFNSDPGY
jgi:hypothetical protein